MQNTAILVTSEARVLAKAHKGLRLVAEGELKTIEGWLMYGAALNEGREMFPSNEQFGQWIVSSNLEGTHPADTSAAMWAAGSPDAFKATRKAHPKVRTVRGLHAKTKAPATPKANIKFTSDDATHAKKLNALAVGGSTEGERENAQVKLDAFAGNFGMTSDEITEKATAEAEIDEYRKPAATVMKQMRNTIASKGNDWITDHLIDAMIRDHATFLKVVEGLKK